MLVMSSGRPEEQQKRELEYLFLRSKSPTGTVFSSWISRFEWICNHSPWSRQRELFEQHEKVDGHEVDIRLENHYGVFPKFSQLVNWQGPVKSESSFNSYQAQGLQKWLYKFSSWV